MRTGLDLAQAVFDQLTCATTGERELLFALSRQSQAILDTRRRQVQLAAQLLQDYGDLITSVHIPDALCDTLTALAQRLERELDHNARSTAALAADLRRDEQDRATQMRNRTLAAGALARAREELAGVETIAHRDLSEDPDVTAAIHALAQQSELARQARLDLTKALQALSGREGGRPKRKRPSDGEAATDGQQDACLALARHADLLEETAREAELDLLSAWRRAVERHGEGDLFGKVMLQRASLATSEQDLRASGTRISAALEELGRLQQAAGDDDSLTFPFARLPADQGEALREIWQEALARNDPDLEERLRPIEELSERMALLSADAARLHRRIDEQTRHRIRLEGLFRRIDRQGLAHPSINFLDGPALTAAFQAMLERRMSETSFWARVVNEVERPGVWPEARPLSACPVPYLPLADFTLGPDAPAGADLVVPPL